MNRDDVATNARQQLPRDDFIESVSEARTRQEQLLRTYKPHLNHDQLQRDWRSELVYFLLPDRFNTHQTEYPALSDEQREYMGRWDFWAISGRNRFQGGTLRGITDQLDYLDDLGVTALWIGPVWKQRIAGLDRNVGPMPGIENDSWPDPEKLTPPLSENPDEAWRVLGACDYYHGYSIQNFLEIDPRFGTTKDLRELVDAAHDRKMRVILDVMINHSSENWMYGALPLDVLRPPYLDDTTSDPSYYRRAQFGHRYPFGAFLDEANHPMDLHDLDASRRDAGVWPREFQNPDVYHRRGFGDYGKPESGRPHDEPRDADWMNRDFAYGDDSAADASGANVYAMMIDIWKYWIAVTDCDGFRVDTMKHVPIWVAHQFCSDVRLFARGALHKDDFLVVGEVGGSDEQAAAEYLKPPATGPDPMLHLLEVDRRRAELRKIATGAADAPTAEYVLMPRLPGSGVPDSVVRDRIMTSIDDHDNLGIECERIARNHAAALLPAVALLLFGPGIPCLYYGTEQALSGPVPDAAKWIKACNYGVSANHIRAADRYLREAMFAPQNPRRAGVDGFLDGVAGLDPMMPGFAAGGWDRPARFDRGGTYADVRRLAKLRREHEQLWRGDIEVSAVGAPGDPFALVPGAPIIAWTRCLHTEDDLRVGLIVVNTGDQTITAAIQLAAGCAPLTTLTRLDQSGSDLTASAALQTNQSTVVMGDIQAHEVRVYGAVAAR